MHQFNSSILSIESSYLHLVSQLQLVHALLILKCLSFLLSWASSCPGPSPEAPSAYCSLLIIPSPKTSGVTCLVMLTDPFVKN